MTDVYVPYCKNKMASEALLTSHRTYLCVSPRGEDGGEGVLCDVHDLLLFSQH